MPETAKRTARVPILGTNGRISDDYIPAAIGENVTKAESAATRAESAATAAEGSASAAGQSATQASGSASAASASASQAKQSATTAGGAATSAKSAQTAAEAAKTAAETARSAAAGSAQDAQQSATAAQQSATSVVDKFISSAEATTLEPGSQATASVADQVLTIGVPKGDKGDKGDPGRTPQRGVDYWTAEDVETVVEDAKAQAVAELAEIGNVPKRAVSDLVAHGEDAYAQKPIEVRVKGQTVKNLWPVMSYSLNGVTVSTDDTGLITVTGTAAGSSVYLQERITGVISGNTVTLLISKAIRGNTGLTQVYLKFMDSSGTQLPENGWVGITTTTTTTASFTIPEGATSVYCGFETAQNGNVNWTGRVMLAEGSEVPDCFTPPASITSVQAGNLITAGKNLFPTGSDDGWYNGGYNSSRAFIQRNNPVTLPYTSVSESEGVGNAFRVVAGQTYTLTVTGYPENFSIGLCWALYETLEDTNDAMKAVKWIYGGGAQKTVTTDVLPISGYLVVCVAGKWTDGSNNVGEYPEGMRIQCELGSTATAYEPPNVTQTPLPEVELRSLPNGTCDELVVKADGTCEVERRTQLVDGEVVALGTPTTEHQSPVTLPKLPAPTFNTYHDSQVPSDMSVEYARDINLVLANLEAVQTALLGGE